MKALTGSDLREFVAVLRRVWSLRTSPQWFRSDLTLSVEVEARKIEQFQRSVRPGFLVALPDTEVRQAVTSSTTVGRQYGPLSRWLYVKAGDHVVQMLGVPEELIESDVLQNLLLDSGDWPSTGGRMGSTQQLLSPARRGPQSPLIRGPQSPPWLRSFFVGLMAVRPASSPPIRRCEQARPTLSPNCLPSIFRCCQRKASIVLPPERSTRRVGAQLPAQTKGANTKRCDECRAELRRLKGRERWHRRVRRAA